ncbi:MAG: hypothetical protein RL536_199 [Candidatus Parcubacteria bacterium]|jgi:hypothetical protein
MKNGTVDHATDGPFLNSPLRRFCEPEDNTYRIHGVPPNTIFVKWKANEKVEIKITKQLEKHPDFDGRGDK